MAIGTASSSQVLNSDTSGDYRTVLLKICGEDD
uniref:Annexin A3 n=1 Tax=Mus musculus TaxID=10090 RepID=A0A0G2JFB3_MOUSE